MPVPLAEFLRLTLPYGDGGPVPVGAIAEAEQADTLGARLFAMWATERNARSLASILRGLSLNEANRLRQIRALMVVAIIERAEERMP